MADTQRGKTALLTTIFQDGQFKGVSAQDMRDLIVSLTPDFAGLDFTTPATSTVSVIGTYVKGAGTTAITNKSDSMSDGGVSNRLVYNGVSMRHFHIVLQASLTLSAGTNQNTSIALYKWDASAGTGQILSHSEAFNTISGTAIEQITSHADTMLDTGDYIEIHVTNNSTTNNVQIDHGYLFGVSMLH